MYIYNIYTYIYIYIYICVCICIYQNTIKINQNAQNDGNRAQPY